MTTKLIGLLVLVGASTFFVMHVMSPPDGTDGGPGADAQEWEPPGRSYRDPLPFSKSEDCKGCHPDVWSEWYDSHHRIAYTNPEVQKLSTGFQGKGLDCLPCHLSRPMFETGFGVRPLERLTRREDGVDCFTCHYWPEGNAMLTSGPLGGAASQAPCQPAVTPSMASLQLCAPCHNQHKVHEDWKETRFAVKGDGFKDCNDCHMPTVERPNAAGGIRRGRSHRFPAAHDPVVLREAAAVTQSLSARSLFVTVHNSGVGHNLPSDERHRAVDLHLVLDTGDGRPYDVRIERWRNPYRDEFEAVNPLPNPGDAYEKTVTVPELLADVGVRVKRVPAPHRPNRKVWYPASTQIPAGEKRELSITLPDGVKAVTVRLWYRTNPFQPDKDAVLLHEKTLPE